MEKKIRSLLIIHEQKSIERIQKILSDYCPQIELIGIAQTAIEGIGMVKRLKPQLVLLDLDLPQGASFDLLLELNDISFQLIFISGNDEYGLEAIKYKVMDYILKPVDVYKLTLAITKVERQINLVSHNKRLQRSIQNFKSLRYQRLAIPGKDGCEMIPVNKIVYCEAFGSCTWFHLFNGRRILSSKNLGKFEKLLPSLNDMQESTFFRTHYKYLVNLKYMTNYMNCEKQIKLFNGETLDVAFRRSKTLRRALLQISICTI